MNCEYKAFTSAHTHRHGYTCSTLHIFYTFFWLWRWLQSVELVLKLIILKKLFSLGNPNHKKHGLREAKQHQAKRARTTSIRVKLRTSAPVHSSLNMAAELMLQHADASSLNPVGALWTTSLIWGKEREGSLLHSPGATWAWRLCKGKEDGTQVKAMASAWICSYFYIRWW